MVCSLNDADLEHGRESGAWQRPAPCSRDLLETFGDSVEEIGHQHSLLVRKAFASRIHCALPLLSFSSPIA